MNKRIHAWAKAMVLSYPNGHIPDDGNNDGYWIEYGKAYCSICDNMYKAYNVKITGKHTKIARRILFHLPGFSPYNAPLV